MKTLKTILVTILFVLISMSCSKDDADSNAITKELNPKFIGTWRFTEVLSSGGFTVVTDYFIKFKNNGEADEWFGTSSNPVNNLTTIGWYTNSNNVVFFNLQNKVENSIPFSMSADGQTILFSGNSKKVYQKI
jgi:hypothetical protein